MHGFRSTFRDWASERTSFPHELCEMALAHTIGKQGRGRLPSRRHDGEAPRADGGLGTVLRGVVGPGGRRFEAPSGGKLMTAELSDVPVAIWAQLAAERRADPKGRVLDLVLRGKLAPKQAEAWARQHGQLPFATTPDPALFNPMLEPAWTFAMAVEWIIRRTPEAVRERWADYVQECWDWCPSVHRFPSRRHPGRVIEVKGFELRQRSVCTAGDVLERAQFKLAMGAKDFAVVPEEARRKLVAALVGCKITAYAGSEPHPIPAHSWLGTSPVTPAVRRGLNDAVYGEDGRTPRFIRTRVHMTEILELWRSEKPVARGAKRGVKPDKRRRVAAQMLDDLRRGILKRGEKQEALSATYGAGRELCVLAFAEALSEFELATKTDTEQFSAA